MSDGLLGGVVGGVFGLINTWVGSHQAEVQYNRNKRLIRLEYASQSALLSQAGKQQEAARQFELQKIELQKAPASTEPASLRNVDPEQPFFGELEEFTKTPLFTYILMGLGILVFIALIKTKRK